VTSNVPVGWRVPASEWEWFEDYVHERYGDIGGYAAREVDSAMREWLDEDAYAEAENVSDRLLERVAREPATLSEKNSGRGSPARDDEETVKVHVRVDPKLKARFGERVDELKRTAELPLPIGRGKCLTRALATRRDGGRAARLTRKLEQLDDATADLLGSAEPALESAPELTGSEPEPKLTKVKRDTLSICRRLPSRTFSRRDLDEAIRAEGLTSNPTIRDYRERVIDELDVGPHPYRLRDEPGEPLYIPSEKVEQIIEENDDLAPLDAPAIDRKHPSKLTRDEKIEGARIAIAREATGRSSNRASWTPADLNSHAFDGQLSETNAYDVARAAAGPPGFKYSTVGPKGARRKCLLVSLADVSSDVLDELRRGLESDRVDSEPSPTYAVADGVGDS
jgi:hypothetical protein